MEDIKEYYKNYTLNKKVDKETAERVFKEMSLLSTEEKHRISYEIKHKNKTYIVYLTKPKSLNLVKYLAEYIFYKNAINRKYTFNVSKWAYTNFIANNGSLSFYLKKQLEFINNIEIYFWFKS